MDDDPRPLTRLSDECAQCLRRQHTRPDCESCREVAQRALLHGNDAAWDLLVTHLWPILLRWIYAEEPELPPSAAEVLGYRVLWQFRHHYANRPRPAQEFPSFPDLLGELHRILFQLRHARGTRGRAMW